MNNKILENKFLQEDVLCKSLSGLDVPFLTITNRINMKDIAFIPELYSCFESEQETPSITSRKNGESKKDILEGERRQSLKKEEEDVSDGKPTLNMNGGVKKEKRRKRKKYVIVGARVHPGESCSSWMMHGFLQFITGASPEAIELRDKIIFKVIPMTNPDGVIAGNYRSSLAGNDLNRQYKDPDPRHHPTVHAIKHLVNDCIQRYNKLNKIPYTKKDSCNSNGINQVQEQLQEKNLNFFPNGILGSFDMHGHSRKKSVFIYGPYYALHNDNYFHMRVFPKLLSDKTNMFRYFSCKFNNEKSKRKAARLVLWKQFNIVNSFTIEASFHGFITQDRKTTHFTQEKYAQMVNKTPNILFEVQTKFDLGREIRRSDFRLHFSLRTRSKFQKSEEREKEKASKTKKFSERRKNENNCRIKKIANIFFHKRPRRKRSRQRKRNKHWEEKRCFISHQHS